MHRTAIATMVTITASDGKHEPVLGTCQSFAFHSPMKRCSKCKESKPLESFSGRPGRPSGYRSRCKECESEYGRRYWKQDPQRGAERNLLGRLRRYGLTLEKYNELLAKQNGGCAICGSTKPRAGRNHLPVDHDHATGKVRGILCDNCNRAIGLLKDDPSLVSRAALYLLDASSQIKTI